MNFNQKIFGYFAGIFFIAVIIVSIYNYYRQDTVYLVTPDNYLTDQKMADENLIDQNLPTLKVLKKIPISSSDNNFDYRIITSQIKPATLDVYLSPKFSDQNLFNSNYSQTRENIMNWIVSEGTVLSDLQINFYLDQNNQKTLIEKLNQ